MHKDVALYINNGNEALDPASMKDVTGCDSDFRYWEGRDDFNVANKSVAKITLKVSACAFVLYHVVLIESRCAFVPGQQGFRRD